MELAGISCGGSPDGSPSPPTLSRAPTEIGRVPASFEASWRGSSGREHGAELPEDGLVPAWPESEITIHCRIEEGSPTGVRVPWDGYSPGDSWRGTLPMTGGTYRLVWDLPGGDTAALKVMIPFEAEPDEYGLIEGYPMGRYPAPGGAPERIRGEASRIHRFYRVTPEDSACMISRRFRLGQFTSKTRPERNYHGDIHYLLLDYTIVETLERIADRVGEIYGEEVGNSIFPESPFRAPDYNAADTAGRASYSQHIYGAACDIIFTRDGDTVTDDLDMNGTVGWEDILPVANEIDAMMERGEIVMGGIGIYRFIYPDPDRPEEYDIHVDCRGYRARWGFVYDHDLVHPSARVAWTRRESVAIRRM